MNFNYDGKSGWITDGTYRHFGHLTSTETGEELAVSIDLQFRLATNGIIVNTLVRGEPLITTSAGLFNQ